MDKFDFHVVSARTPYTWCTPLGCSVTFAKWGRGGRCLTDHGASRSNYVVAKVWSSWCLLTAERTRSQMENFRYFNELNRTSVRLVCFIKIPYTLCAWILKSIAFSFAQKVSSVKTLYAGPSKSLNIWKILALKNIFFTFFKIDLPIASLFIEGGNLGPCF